MNTDTGRIYALGADFDPKRIEDQVFRDAAGSASREPALKIGRFGSTFIADELGSRQIPPGERDVAREHADALKAKMAEHAGLAAKVLGRDLTGDERAALADALKGQTIVPVSTDVAQTVRLGQREQERRRRRRKASKRARRSNRG